MSQATSSEPISRRELLRDFVAAGLSTVQMGSLLGGLTARRVQQLLKAENLARRVGRPGLSLVSLAAAGVE